MVSFDKVVISEKVQQALEQLRPFLEADGGDMELVNITDECVVQVRLLGACKDCTMSKMTLKAGLEEAIKKVAPEVTKVEAIETPEMSR